MKHFICASALVLLIASVAVLQNRAVGQTPAGTTVTAGPDQHRAMLNTYCVGCHNTRLRTGGLALDGLDLQTAANDAQIWEKALRKLRGHLMPPPGSPQPPQKDVDSFVAWMENTLDSHAQGPSV
jgi:mono/diheme cytochrome c family protein